MAGEPTTVPRGVPAMVVGTHQTGWYALGAAATDPDDPSKWERERKRISPVFRSKGEADAWLARSNAQGAHNG
jgi:hypothetical protein